MENEDLMKVVTEKANMWLGEGYAYVVTDYD